MEIDIPLSLRRTYLFIKDFIQTQEYAPTAAEIATGIGIRSRGVVYRNLKGLETAGLITLLPKRHRNIRLTGKPLSQLRAGLPLIGTIEPDGSISPLPDETLIDIITECLGPNHFGLLVKDNNKLAQHILPEDILIFESSQQVKNGDVALVLVNNQPAALMYVQFHKEDNITLTPFEFPKTEAQTYAANAVNIQGRYLGLLRLSTRHAHSNH